MKILASLFFSVTLSFADEMQQMLQQMQAMQSCMAKIDYNALEPLQKETLEAEAKIKKLCHTGHQKEAQAYAIKYVHKVLNAPILLQIHECSKGSPMEELMQVSEEDFKSQDVCNGKTINLGLPNTQRINW